MCKTRFFSASLVDVTTATLGIIGFVVLVTCSAMTIKFFACLAYSMGYSYRTDKVLCCRSFCDV
jgi:hypothetical protein